MPIGSYYMDSTSASGGQYSNKTHQFGGSKHGVLHKECKQVSWCHIKLDLACQVCTIVPKNGQCSSDSMDVKTAPCSRDKIHTSDIRKLLKPTVPSNSTRLVTNSNEVALSNRLEALATNSDVESDTQTPLSMPSDSVHSLHLQRSVCSDDRNLTIKEPNIDATLVVPKNSKARKSDTVNTCLEIHEKVTSDSDIRSVHPVHLLGNLDAMDPVTQVIQIDTVDFTPMWCTDFERCKKQIGLRFGCVPLSPISTYSGPDISWQNIPSIIEAHRLVRASGKPNFLGTRIPVQNTLKADRWRQYLVNYFDQQLPDLIEFWFPLSFDRNLDLTSTPHNHPSAIQILDHVDKYIQELAHQAIIGPFYQMPFKMHISPFMTMDKAGSNTRRTIMDLSWAKGASVNDGVLKDSYLGTDFQMHYPSVDTIIQQVIETGPAARIFKVDISRAF